MRQHPTDSIHAPDPPRSSASPTAPPRRPPGRWRWGRGSAVVLALLPLLAGAAAAEEPRTEEIRPVEIPATATATATAVGEAVSILTVDEIRRGQRGYGLSVFAGSEPQPFDVEILGVIHNNSPGTDFILARLSGDFEGGSLERSGVIRGMSGSPVFVDDRLIGAVAFSWAFTEGALAGITPIRQMRHLEELPRPAGHTLATPVQPVTLAQLQAGDLPADLLERQLSLLAPATALGHPASLQWSAAGFGEASRGLLERSLGPLASVAPMGRMASSGAAAGDAQEGEAATVDTLGHGGSVAAVLVDGDLRLAAAGTVTDRTGDSVLAFGHPFLGVGPILVPMAEAEVVTVVLNQSNSFKLTNMGRIVGAFEQDRQSGIQGRLGVEAPMVPVTVRVGERDGEIREEFRLRVSGMPQLTASLMALGAFGALDSTHYSAGRMGLDLDLRLVLRDHGELHLRQSFDGPNAVGETVTYLVANASYLTQNDLERVELEEVEIELRHADRPATVTLVGAHAERSVVRPGQDLTLNLDLLPWRGDPFRRSLTVTVPRDTPEGQYYFFVGDGANIDAARLTLEPTEPINLEQALDLLRSFHSRRQLGVLGFFSGSGLAVAGEVMPRLPGSMAAIWGASSSGSARPLRLVVAQETYQPLDYPLEGLARIDLEVRRRDPLSHTQESDPGDPGEESP